MTTITIQEDNKPPIILTFDEVCIEIENGLYLLNDIAVESRFEPNGQQRMLLKAWTGCHTYESFTTD